MVTPAAFRRRAEVRGGSRIVWNGACWSAGSSRCRRLPRWCCHSRRPSDPGSSPTRSSPETSALPPPSRSSCSIAPQPGGGRSERTTRSTRRDSSDTHHGCRGRVPLRSHQCADPRLCRATRKNRPAPRRGTSLSPGDTVVAGARGSLGCLDRSVSTPAATLSHPKGRPRPGVRSRPSLLQTLPGISGCAGARDALLPRPD